MTQEPSKAVCITEKGIAVLREVDKYPESERTAAYMAIRDGYYEQWQEDRLKILNAEIID